MSEELKQKTWLSQFGRFKLLNIGDTTFNQLKEEGIIKINQKGFKLHKIRKPDGLIVDNKKIVAAIESKENLINAKKQGLGYTKDLKIPLLIVTNNSNKSKIYNGISGKEIILNKLVTFKDLVKDESWETYIDELIMAANNNETKIKEKKHLDLSDLSGSLWQKIWSATGKSSIKCLYNVVELILFKYLSDKKLINDLYNFDTIYKLSKNEPKLALKRYVNETRKEILKDFPKGEDGTTILNGVIFINDDGTYNTTQKYLFQTSLQILNEYSIKNGNFENISKSFKTKLFENFVNDDSKSSFGQFFTPRKIVQSIIRMSGILQDPREDLIIGDPFCGVGGFLLEILNLYKKNILETNITMRGYDKGIDSDDERTIILAKANALLYNSDFITEGRKNKVSKWINDTFILKRDNLGTFAIGDEKEKYNYIFSNPPYLTSGSESIKNEIKHRGFKGNFPVFGSGLEALAIEWIINSLMKNGKGFIILPKGVLESKRNIKIRKFIVDEVNIKAIISLPMKTFFGAAVETNILIFDKKDNKNIKQKSKIFLYRVKNIGEKLTSKLRKEIIENDLPILEDYYEKFKINKLKDYENDKNLKIITIDEIIEKNYELDNRKFYHDYLIKTDKKDALLKYTSEFSKYILKFNETINKGKLDIDDMFNKTKSITLNDTKYFKTYLGKRIRKKDCELNPGKIIVYGSNTYENDYFGKISEKWINKNNKHLIDSKKLILLNVLGSVGYVHIRGKDNFKYSFTDSTKAIEVINPDLDIEYCLSYIRYIFSKFNMSYTANLSNNDKINNLIKIKIPIKNNKIDKDKMKKILKILKKNYDSILELKHKTKEFYKNIK